MRPARYHYRGYLFSFGQSFLRRRPTPNCFDEIHDNYLALRVNRERKCADTTGTVPVLWAGHFQYCKKILIYFSNKIHGSNFIERHSETVMVWNYWNADCSLRKKYCVDISYKLTQIHVLTYTFAYIVYQLVSSRYARVLHLFFITVSSSSSFRCRWCF